MEKGYPPQESAPPYPGPPVNYGGGPPPPGMYPQPGFSPAVSPSAYQAGGSYAPAMAAPTQVTHMIVTPALHESPGHALCPHCQQTVLTKTTHSAGLMTWLICGGLAIFGCFLCCCIPFCIDACQDVEHRCSSCNRVIYVYKRI